MSGPPDTARGRIRVLFMAEAVTLAHVARPAALLSRLDASLYDSFVACPRHSHRFITVRPDRLLDLDSLALEEFTRRLRHGKPVLTEHELQARVRTDLALFERVDPHVVVGDFRLSLSISARIAGVPVAFISNAYWSPYAADQSLPLPVLPWTRHAPLRVVQAVFDRLQPLVLAPHLAPANAVRQAYGLPCLTGGIRQLYTDADALLYADAEALFPLRQAPAHHRHVGPVVWSPPLPPPDWWDEPGDPGPLAYVTLGSSGDVTALAPVVDGLLQAGFAVIASTAGAALPHLRRQRLRMAPYLPGAQAAARSDLVVCNGGSPTSQQALACGVPVVGICSNMDQMLNMRGLEAAGVGVGVRADRVDRAGVVRAARAALDLAARSRALAGVGVDDSALRATLDSLAGRTAGIKS